MDVLKRLADSVVVPVVVLEKAEDAMPTANAMLAGGIDTMEITFRTACAADAIKAVADHCPDMLVGAGTVLNLEQAKLAVSMGAKFIVSPGFSEEVVAWCVENGIAVAPGCVTPSEIMSAKKYGLKMVKFFPANVYGGLTALKNLAAPFGDMKFLPTGGVNADNVGDFISAPFIHAVGGSWVCPKAEIAAGNWEKITNLCREARKAALGFEVVHVGINMPDAEASPFPSWSGRATRFWPIPPSTRTASWLPCTWQVSSAALPCTCCKSNYHTGGTKKWEKLSPSVS